MSLALLVEAEHSGAVLSLPSTLALKIPTINEAESFGTLLFPKYENDALKGGFGEPVLGSRLLCINIDGKR